MQQRHVALTDREAPNIWICLAPGTRFRVARPYLRDAPLLQQGGRRTWPPRRQSAERTWPGAALTRRLSARILLTLAIAEPGAQLTAESRCWVAGGAPILFGSTGCSKATRTHSARVASLRGLLLCLLLGLLLRCCFARCLPTTQPPTAPTTAWCPA